MMLSLVITLLLHCARLSPGSVCVSVSWCRVGAGLWLQGRVGWGWGGVDSTERSVLWWGVGIKTVCCAPEDL